MNAKLRTARFWILGGCLTLLAALGARAAELIEVAVSPEFMWNGAAVSKDGRLFACFPSMAGTKTIAVGEIRKDGTIQPYPGGTWNDYTPGGPTKDRFVGTNAVLIDKEDQLWVVDAAGGFGSVPLMGEAKLVRIDLATNTVKREYRFDAQVLPEKGFINDVRVEDGFAYLTDSGLGALIVLNLESGQSRRVLASDPRLKADTGLELKVNGQPYLNAKNETPKMNVNPLELGADGKYLYFQPNGGPRLLRLPVEKLNDFTLDDAALAKAIEDIGPTKFNAGMTSGPDGSIYYSDIEIGGITRRTLDGRFETVVSDPDKIVWPDASRIGPDGYLYFPAAQVNRLPANNPSGESQVQLPFRMFKVKVPSE